LKGPPQYQPLRAKVLTPSSESEWHETLAGPKVQGRSGGPRAESTLSGRVSESAREPAKLERLGAVTVTLLSESMCPNFKFEPESGPGAGLDHGGPPDSELELEGGGRPGCIMIGALHSPPKHRIDSEIARYGQYALARPSR
jgi:hypothetical protein